MAASLAFVGGGASVLGVFALPQTSYALILVGFALVTAGTLYLDLAKCPRCGVPLVEGSLLFVHRNWLTLSFPRRCRKCSAPLDSSQV
jgi:hypothetical protein